MSLPHLIAYVVVLGIGVPASFRNWTALTLLLSWTAGEFTWFVTGNSLPLKFYFMTDMAVLVVILAKATVKAGRAPNPFPFMSFWDRLIAGGFVFAAWPAYVLAFDLRTKWFLLFGIVIAQFLCAGGESVQALLGERKERRRNRHNPPGSVSFTPARELGGYV